MIEIGETYKGLTRISFKDALKDYLEGKPIKMLPNRARIDYTGYLDSPWINIEGELLVFIDKEKTFKKIGQMTPNKDFRKVVEEYEDEWCDCYNGKRAAFLRREAA